jgi:hypothetical protein
MIPMEMKTKKNKMVLAMAVVAALAMVSVAGIATFSDDSEADTVSMLIGTTYDVDKNNSAMELNLVVDIWNIGGTDIGLGIGNVHVGSDVTVTGTINVGYKDASGKFVVTDSLKVTNASGFNVTVVVISAEGDLGNLSGLLGLIPSLPSIILDDRVSFLGVGNDDSVVAPTGAFELTKGEAILGSISTPEVVQVLLDAFVNGGGSGNLLNDLLDAVTPFTGNLKVKGLELEAVDVAGVLVSAEGSTAILTGGAASLPGYDAELTIKGVAVVDYPAEVKSVLTILSSGMGLDVPQGFISYNAAVIIDADAEITIGNIEPLAVGEFSVETGDNIYFAMLYSANGQIYYPASWSSTEAYFENVPVGTYTFVAYTVTNDVIYSTNFGVSGSMGKYNVNLGTNRVTIGANGQMADADLVFDTTNEWIEYPTTFTPQVVYNVTNDEFGVLTADGIVFPDYGLAAADEILFIAANRGIPGTPVQVYLGPSTGTVYNDALVVKSTLNSGEIFVGADVYSQDSVGYYYMLGDSTLEVKGTLKFLYQSEAGPEIRGIMANNAPGHITLSDEGVIEYGVFPGLAPIAPSMGSIDAAYYFKNVTDSGVVTKSTYYFTTITKAINDSDGADIVLVGYHEILVDTNWSVDKSTKIIIGDGAQTGTLNIGRYVPGGDETITAALTIDEQIEIIVTGGSDFEVRSGQAIFLSGTEPLFPPTAHVRIVNPDKIIYADVATGFTIVKSGETLELITDAELRNDATLIAGATFDDMGFEMTIPSGMTLTVNGTYLSTVVGLRTGKLIVEDGGTLIINNGTATFADLTEVLLQGSLKINAAGTMTLDGTMDGDGTGILIIDGIFDANGIVADLSELVLRGTLNIRSGNAPFNVLKKITIGAEPVLLTALQNNAVLNGVIDIDDLTLILVYGNSAIGVANFNNPGDIVSTKFVYQNLSTVYATQYGVDGAVPAVANLEYLTCDALRDFKLVGWYQSAGLSILGEVTPAQFLVSAVGEYPVLFGDFVPKTFTITLQDTNQGINWLVDGVGKGASNVLTFNYGDVVRINVHVLQGFTGTPVIQKDGAAYTANTAFTVTDNYVFTVSGVSVADRSSGDGDGLTLIEILLIIIVIIIGIISIFVALRLLRS